jgi:8-oxo-dGTP pyrophosphatase MutT (NUDIX family)
VPHIHTQPGQHDFTASAFIVLKEEGSEPRLWLHQHRLIGKWLQFGGHVELHETPWQTVCHEIVEESGYAIGQLKLLQPDVRLRSLSRGVSHPLPFNVSTHDFPVAWEHFHTDLSYAFVTTELPANAVAAGESGVMKPMTRDELCALSAEEILLDVQELALFVMETILPKWGQVDCDSYQV